MQVDFKDIVNNQYDVGVFLTFGGACGLTDVFFNVAPDATSYTVSIVSGAFFLGLKKLIVPPKLEKQPYNYEDHKQDDSSSEE